MKLMIRPMNNYSKANSIQSFKQLPMERELDKVLNKTMETLAKRIEFEIPEYGRLFAPVKEEFTNPNEDAIAHTIKFLIKPSTNKDKPFTRILKMEILSKDQNSIAPIFEVGTKQELLEKVKDTNLLDKIKDQILNIDPNELKKRLD